MFTIHWGFIIVYIDDVLVYFVDISYNLEHLEMFYGVVYEHGITLSKKKLEFAKTKMCFFRIGSYGRGS